MFVRLSQHKWFLCFRILLPLDGGIILIRWSDVNPKEIPFETVLKVSLMVFDISLYENQYYLISGHRVIEDFNHFPTSYIQQVTPTVSKKILLTVQKGYPLRLKGLYAINVPSFMKTIIESLAKPFLSKKLYNRVRLSFL